MPQEEASYEPDTATANRRRDVRIPTDSQIELEIETRELQGAAQDLSAQGICFFTENEVRVRVRVNGTDAEPTSLPGRIVRIESVTDGKYVVAVRFDQRINPRRMSS